MKNQNIQTDIFKRTFNKRNHPFALRMAPMIDMIFLLLIFFLVAAKFRPQEDFLPLQLPVANAQNQTIGKPEPLTIHISSTNSGCLVKIGQFHAVQIENDNIEAGLAVLMEKTRDCLLAQKRFADDPVEIICNADVKWEHLAKIYNLFYGTGMTDITFEMTE